MKSIYVALTCRNCGYQTHKQSETLIISDFEPYLKKQLIEGKYFNATCPCCKSRIDFLHSCLFVEKKYKYILYIKPKKNQKEADHMFYKDKKYRKRYISDAAMIKETIQILEDGYDDRAIMMIKLKLLLFLKAKNKFPQSIQYYDTDTRDQSIWFKIEFGGGKEMMAVDRTVYEKYRLNVGDEDWNHYQTIDVEWAIQYEKNNNFFASLN